MLKYFSPAVRKLPVKGESYKIWLSKYANQFKTH
jgi:hypothetical protein